MTKRERLLGAKGWRGRGLDALVGGLAVLGLAPFHIWPLFLLCFGWLALRWARAAAEPSHAAKLCRSRGFWFGFGYFLFGLFWIGSAFIARGPSFIPLMIPAVLLLCSALSFFWALAGHFYAKLKPQGLWTAAVFASLLSAAEITRGHIFSGFPWNLPGYVFKAGTAPSQLASVIGIYGLSFLVCLLAGYLAHYLAPYLGSTNEEQGGAAKAPTARLSVSARRAGLIFLGGLLALYGFGVLRLSLAAPIEFHPDVNLRIVQTPFAQKDNLNPNGSVEIANAYLATTASAGLENVTHVIWPEGSVNGLALENEPLLRAASDLFLSFDNSPPHWLISTLREDRRAGPNSQAISHYYNSSAAIEFSPDGSAAISAINDKLKLVPFGEGLPYADIVEKLGVSPMSTAASFVTPAPAKELANFPDLPKLSPQICYEIIFTGMTPRKADAAQWILNQSNDGWYGQSTGPRQHANQAAYRAIEEGLPIVRSAGNGISGVIDPYGRWHSRAEPKDNIALDTRLPKRIKTPVYSPKIIWLLILINIAICLLYSYRRSKQRGAVIDYI